MWTASYGVVVVPCLVDDSSVVQGGEGLADSCRRGKQVAPTGRVYGVTAPAFFQDLWRGKNC
jgi:hypothetical protein